MSRDRHSAHEFILRRVASISRGIFYILAPPVELVYVVDFKQHVGLSAFFREFAAKLVGNAYEFLGKNCRRCLRWSYVNVCELGDWDLWF
jgi:hypothetical protein